MEAEPADRARLVLAAAAVLVVALVAYAGNLDHGFVFDDHVVVAENERIRSLEELGSLFATPYWGVERNDGLYRPLALLSYAVDYQLFGERPRGYHLVNDLLHACNALLVLLIAWRMLGSWLAGAAVGLLFALHPIHTEAVNWIIGRAELLAAFFVLAALLLALRPRPLDWRVDPGRTAGVLLLGLAGVLSKEHAVIAIPAVIGAVLAVERGRGGAPRAWRDELLRHGGLAAAWIVLLAGWWALRGHAIAGERLVTGFYDNQLVDATAAERLWTSLSVFSLWLEKLVLPYRFSVDYSWPVLPTLDSPAHLRVWLALAALGGLSALAVVLWRGSAAGAPQAPAGPRAPLAAVGFWIAFLQASWLPTSNLVAVIGTLFGERLLYLPSVAWCMLLGWALSRLPTRAAGIALALIAPLFGALTWTRTRDWESDRTLYAHERENRPASARTLRNYATAIEATDPEEAEAVYREVVGLCPDYPRARQAFGTFLLEQGRHAQAVEQLAAAERLRPDDPTTLLNLGAAYAPLGRVDDAERCWRRLLELQPGNGQALRNLERLRRGGAEGAGPLGRP